MLQFSFPDRALGYDCVRCASHCCRGFGIALGHNELVQLVARAPGLAPFLRIQQKNAASFNPLDGCWALASDGRCTIENEHGYAAKPSTCRLFPLRFVELGPSVIVDIQLWACPLELASPSVRTVIDQQAMRAELTALLPTAGRVQLSPPRAAPDEWLAIEAQRRDDAMAAGSLSALVTTTPWAAAIAMWPTLLPSRGGDHDHAATIDAMIRTSLGPLRLWALTQAGTIYGKRARTLDAELLALAAIAAWSASAGRAPSLRGVFELWTHTSTLRTLLLAADRPLVLRDDADALPANTDAAIVDAWRAVLATDGDLPTRLAVVEPALRPLMLRALADRADLPSGY